MVQDMNVTYPQLNKAMSVNFVGLSVGCILFIPLAKKFGRRPVYLASTAIMMAASFWCASMKSLPEMYIINLLHGLAGATNESIVQITVCTLGSLNTGVRYIDSRLPIFSLCITAGE